MSSNIIVTKQIDVISSTHLQGITKASEVSHLSTKDEVSQLTKSKEDDEEHDRKSSQVLGAVGNGRGQLGHGFVEADVFENLKIQTYFPSG